MWYQSVVLGKPSQGLKEYTEADLRDKIYDMEKGNYTKKRKEIDGKDSNLRYLYKDLKRLEGKEPHPYQENLYFLKDIF